MNAGAAIYAAGLAATLAEGMTLAGDAISTGRAKQTLQALVEVSNSV
jgi:anthranilate phosphoribosyltransferase